jgi:ankyrin repeat protein
MKANLRRLFQNWIAFGIVVSGCSVNYAKPMNATDYFETASLITLADAAQRGQTDKIKHLLAEGVPIDGQGKEGMTPLIWAILHQNMKGVQCLLENKANPNLQMTASKLTTDGLTDGNSAVSLAAMHEDPWYLGMVLKYGGNPNIVNLVKSITPIFQCIKLFDSSHPRLEHLKMLIAAGADLNSQDRNGLTPMMTAAMANRYDMVYIMLEAGADPTIKNKWGSTILFQIRTIRTDPEHSLYQWRTKVVELLKAKGIDVEHGK